MQPVGVQEIIHKFEEGEGTKYIRLLFCILALLGLAAVWHIREAKNFFSVEAMDAAQVARNVARGHGFSTEFVRPLSMAILEERHGQSPEILSKPHPDLANPPVYPLLLAGSMKVLPYQWAIPTGRFWRYQPEVLIGALNQVLFFAALILLFRVASRLFDRPVALLAVVLMALTEVYWQFVTSGLSTMLLIFLFILLIDFLVTFEEAARSGLKGKGWLIGYAVACGLLVGVMALTRYSMGWLIIPVAAYLAFTGTNVRVPAAVLSLLACGLLMSPWLARNYRLSGSLYGTAALSINESTIAYPGNSLERSMPSKLGFALNKVDLQEYGRKLFVNGGEIIQSDLPEAGGTWMAALFLAAMLIPFRNPALGRLKYFALVTFFGYVAVQALGKTELSVHAPKINSENLLVIFTPLFFIFGSGFFFVLLDQVELPALWVRRVIITGFIVAMSLPLIFRLMPPRNMPVNYPPYYPPTIQNVSRWVAQDELIMSDMPWAVAWYGDRQCVWTTMDYGEKPKDDFYKINDSYKAIKAIYLTPLTTKLPFLHGMRLSPEGIWGKFYLDVVVMKNLPTGYPLKFAPPDLLPDMLFLSDRIRWHQ
jgi:hypothetical protein